MLTLKWVCVALIFFSTIIAAFYPFIKKIKYPNKVDFPIGEAFAGGVFLGAGLIHMLGEASRDFLSRHYEYPFAFLLAGSIFLILLWFEHIGRELYEHKHGSNSINFVYLSVVMLAIHSFLEGAALGLSDSFSVMIVILAAILAHKWAASFALAIQISSSPLPISSGIFWFCLFAIMTPLGILFGATILEKMPEDSILVPVFMSLAAGTFLYLGTLHGLKRAVMIDRCCDLRQFGFVVLGFFIMAIVALWT